MQYCKNVTLRERKLAHDKISLYLDYYPGVRDKVTMKNHPPRVSWHLHLCQSQEQDGACLQQTHAREG